MHPGANAGQSWCTLFACHAADSGTRRSKRTATPCRTTGANRTQVVVREATRVERLAYTRSQAAEALGMSRSTFNRRILPFIDTLEMDWGARLIPVDALERFLAERRQEARAEHRRPARLGRKAGLPPEIVARIRHQHANGKSLNEIARRLNADGVPTSQDGRQWWPSTVRAVLLRPNPPEAARVSAQSS